MYNSFTARSEIETIFFLTQTQNTKFAYQYLKILQSKHLIGGRRRQP